MISFSQWLAMRESSASTRRAIGLYPPQPGDLFVRPPYGKDVTCKKLGGFKLVNMDVTKICGEPATGAEGKKPRRPE